MLPVLNSLPPSRALRMVVPKARQQAGREAVLAAGIPPSRSDAAFGPAAAA